MAKTVITYGTFDLLHAGHINILKRARALADKLIVGVTSEEYDYNRGKLNVCDPLLKRIENVRNTGLADEIIVEEYFGQKVADIQKHNVDIFVIGSDWQGQFDYLKEYCEVIYLERTKGVSSTELRAEKNSILDLGIVGHGRIAKRFVQESKYVSGVNVRSVYGRDPQHAAEFKKQFELEESFTDYDQFLDTVDAVYIATPHKTHYDFCKAAIMKNKHVLCEKPMTLSQKETESLFTLANEHNVVLFEAIKTAYAPGFNRLVNVAKSGIIGNIMDVTASFTKLVADKNLREYDKNMGGGSMTELGTYPLCAILKILGTDIKKYSFSTIKDPQTGVDIYTKIYIDYANATATANIGIGVKREGDLVIAGTNGYIYVPAPWWLTEYFEIRAEDPNKREKFFTKFEGDGLRYELSDFAKTINEHTGSYKFQPQESICIAKIIDNFLNKYS